MATKHALNAKHRHTDTNESFLLSYDTQAKKGAMKSGTTGRKVGPLKMMNGFHVDNSPLELKVLVSA
jgi:hypothetical protein